MIDFSINVVRTFQRVRVRVGLDAAVDGNTGSCWSLHINEHNKIRAINVNVATKFRLDNEESFVFVKIESRLCCTMTPEISKPRF